MKTNQKTNKRCQEEGYMSQAKLLNAVEKSLLLDRKSQGTLLTIITDSIL
ncbi:hypothetical protein J4460_01860 [Candidatus Woesearchaeota archaeon]|nr:MAG: hypothetical protein QS99_C0003G0049 [archaeon GW2011_AR4]MBS3129397.1 hypothetical protein [Candidatus Woesearchaeota archaeon]HIH38438.1 hypothetical protein [Candidatus Woesearchaeota archaeon]HIH48103.1 hypothetical protein [Candidatus Woesearchaeota archaeon]HIJ03451.1 hypothetical protein [Candidatus Woesearchaeota archaeon]